MPDDEILTNQPAPRRGLLLGAAAAVALMAGAGWAWHRRQDPDAGQALPANFWDLNFDAPSGPRLSLAAFRGHPILLNFWATWCPPCIAELPLLNAFSRQNAANGWQVVGIAVDKPGPVNAFLRQTPLDYPVGLAGMSGLELSQQLGNEAGGLPFSVLIGSQGRLRERKIGRLAEDDLNRWQSLG